MPITATVESSRNLTRLVVAGVVSAAEMRRAIEQFWESPALTRDVIWDYSEASLTKLSVGELRDLVPVGKRYGHRLAERRGGKTAIVAPGDLAYGMMRVSETLSGMSEYTFEIRVFRSMEEADAWLGAGG